MVTLELTEQELKEVRAALEGRVRDLGSQGGGAKEYTWGMSGGIQFDQWQKIRESYQAVAPLLDRVMEMPQSR